MFYPGYEPIGTGQWLLAIGYWLLAIGYKSLEPFALNSKCQIYHYSVGHILAPWDFWGTGCARGDFFFDSQSKKNRLEPHGRLVRNIEA
jgi:hypothetical protein